MTTASVPVTTIEERQQATGEITGLSATRPLSKSPVRHCKVATIRRCACGGALGCNVKSVRPSGWLLYTASSGILVALRLGYRLYCIDSIDLFKEPRVEPKCSSRLQGYGMEAESRLVQIIRDYVCFTVHSRYLLLLFLTANAPAVQCFSRISLASPEK